MYEVEVTLKFKVVPQIGSTDEMKLRQNWDEPDEIASTLTYIAAGAIAAKQASWSNWKLKRVNHIGHIYQS